MINGETVVVKRRVEVGRDPGNSPIYEWQDETVDGVLVAPGPLNDVTDGTRPDGVEIAFNLHFPIGYPETLRNALVLVRGDGPFKVVGDPRHYTGSNTPGPWSMPCEVGLVVG